MNENKQDKILGEERRQLILHWLMEADKPLSGSALAKKTNVSRQVIVQDISLLKARNEPILATSQGYVYVQPLTHKQRSERVIACLHPPDQVEQELTILVDHGVTIKDVRVEHPVYGSISAPIFVSTRREVADYLQKIKDTNAAYLSQLTGGVHLHTIEADSTRKLDDACQALRVAGFLA